jgi:O-antigen/teichoic acid export membrane protein
MSILRRSYDPARPSTTPAGMNRAWPATLGLIALIVFAVAWAQTTVMLALVMALAALVAGAVLLTLMFGTAWITRPRPRTPRLPQYR